MINQPGARRLPVMAALAILFLAGMPAFAQEDPLIAARKRCEDVESLYNQGKYEECRAKVDLYFSDPAAWFFTDPLKARLYRLKGFLVYAYRTEDTSYVAEVKALFQRAVELDLGIDIGKLADVPTALFELFNTTKEEYVSRYSRTRRQNNIGVYLTVNVQPGIYYAFNILPALSLVLEADLPVKPPILDAVSGQVGINWYPAWLLEQPFFALDLFYRFQLSGLTGGGFNYTHSFSIAGQAEFNSRLGLGLLIRTEIIRLDLYMSSGSGFEPPSYGQMQLVPGLLKMGYANLSFCVFYTF
jgi:hypothetical protein